MAKIGLDLRLWPATTGGIGRYSRNLLAELLRLDTKNQYTAIITPAGEAEFTLTAPNLKKLVVDIPHYSLAEQRRLPKILAAEQFDLVHFAHFNHPIRYQGRFVVTVHDLIMHLFPSPAQKRSPIKNLAYRLVIRDCRRAAKILVPSEATKNDLVSMLKFPAAKIVVTPEGSEGQFHPHSSAEIAAVRAKFGLPERFLLFVSRWTHYKGLPTLLEAYKNLHKTYPDLGLVICGRPEKNAVEVEEQVRALVQSNPQVVTPGFVADDDLAAIYSAATTYVHPSLYEGFGIMILEAMAAGAPVVTSNVSSLPEVVGDAGLLVDPHRVDDVTAAIEKILTDPALAAALQAKGFERAKQYSWAKMAEQTLAAYQEVLASTPHTV